MHMVRYLMSIAAPIEDRKPKPIKVEPALIDNNVILFQHAVTDFKTWLAQIMPTKEIKLAIVTII